MSACAEPTHAGHACRRPGRWLSGYNLKTRCYRHAVKIAHDENAATIFDPATGRCLQVCDLPEPRKPQRTPKTVAEFIAALDECDGSNPKRVSNLFVAAMDAHDLVGLHSATPFRKAIDAAKGRVARYEREHATC